MEVGPDSALIDIDFTLTTGATISGRVTDAATGRPIAKADVNADSSGEGSNVWTQTAEDGSYFLSGLAPAGYRVQAKGDGYIEQVFDDQTAWDRADLVFVGEDSEHTGIDFALKIGGTITGRVIDQATGRPVVNVGVGAENAGDGPSNWTTADRDGRYALTGIAPGAYRIKASAQEKGYIEVFYPDTPYWDDADLVLVSGTEDVAGIDFALRQGAILSGRVTDAQTGQPVARLSVGAHSEEGGPGGFGQTRFDGVYTIEGLAPGRYVIKVEGDDLGYARQYYGDTPLSEQAEVVSVTESGVDSIDIGVRRGATISGRVTDAGTGRGIPEMDINADLRGEWLGYDSTDSNGDYTLTGLPEGEIRVAVSGQGYLEQDRTVFVEEGQHIEGFDF